MPFIPPVSLARSVSGLTGLERPVDNTLPATAAAAAKKKVKRDDKSISVKERLTSNLKQLGKKSQPMTRLSAAKEVLGPGLHAKSKDRSLPSSQTESIPTSSSGESLSKTEQHKPVISVKSDPEEKTRARLQEEVRFTLTLTPEAVLLLQRRSSEKRQHLASKNAGSGGVTGSASDSRRRRDNISRRHQAASQRHCTQNNWDPVLKNSDAELRDICSIVKISLLNEQHKYDDVEYEEEQNNGVDERVVLKCTEWLRGLDNTPVTVGNCLQAV